MLLHMQQTRHTVGRNSVTFPGYDFAAYKWRDAAAKDRFLSA